MTFRRRVTGLKIGPENGRIGQNQFESGVSHIDLLGVLVHYCGKLLIKYTHLLKEIMHFNVIGIKGPTSFETIVSHFTSMGGDVVLLDSDMVAGKDHAMSAALHAERAFREGTNRSKTLQTEIIIYCAWERQIGKAMAKMRPKKGRDEFVAVLMNVNDPRLDEIGMIRDDSIVDATPWKAERLGLRSYFLSPEDQAIENVAIVELQKI